MTTSFTYPPENYIAESKHASRFWFLWLPMISFPITVAVAYGFPQIFQKWFQSETTGVIEFIHFLFPAIVALISLRLMLFSWIRQQPLILAWCGAMFVGGFYLSGEEASWGQHYVGWNTSEFWSTINDQGETNLHNTLGLLDQFPRLILFIGIVVTGLIYPWLLINRPQFLPRQFDFTYPALALRPLAVLVLASWLWSKLQAPPLHKLEILFAVRGGEFQETYIVWFLLGYALFLYRRAKTYQQQIFVLA